MVMITNPPAAPAFRLSMLIYDTRYRSLTIQCIALIGFMLFASWIINNTLVNLRTLGKPFELNFFTDPASYDINQRLLDYTSRDTHLRASLLGLLNTLVVALMGCVTATIVGVLVGVLRLSRNWLIARIMTVYVEIFRNVPVLLWILLTLAILIESLPRPADFRGEDPTASLVLFDSVAFTNRGTYIPEPLFSRGLGDLPLLGESSLRFQVSLDLLLLLAVVAASIFAIRWNLNRAKKVQEATGERPATWHATLGLLFVPTLIVLWGLGFHLGYPELKGFNFQGGIHLRNSLIALWIALSLYTSAFIAEITRGGILAISSGQSEAASALGLRPNRIMSLVILPQALRVIIPPMISQYLNLTKNSSLAIAVGYMDLTGTLGGITLNQTGRELECVLILMLVYLFISLSVSAVLNWYNAKVKLVER